MGVPMLKEMKRVARSWVLGNLPRALPKAAKQSLRKARQVCCTLPNHWKNGIDRIPRPIGAHAL
eukprot:5332357-Lingulodinium_polyedra.AAC.1